MATEQQSIPDLLNILKADISTPLDAGFTERTLSSPPFINIEGIFNLRDTAGRTPTSGLKPKYAFRSGTLEQLEFDGYEAVQKLGIKSIFDLRSLKETTEHPDPPIGGGIEVVSVPSTLENETTVQAQKSQEEKEDHTLVGMCLTVLETHKAVFKVVLQHVRDHPDQPFLFHCTAGKDRTGVLAYLLHSLAGSPMEVANLDYALTRVGIEPVREFLTSKITGNGKMELTDPRVAPYAGVPIDGMSHLDSRVREKHGGVENYVRNVLGLSNDDIGVIKNNLRG